MSQTSAYIFAHSGYKKRATYTVAAEPTPATRYMRSHSMVTGDALLAFHDLLDEQRFVTPEKDLMYAVLREALKDFQRHWFRPRRDSKRRIFDEAKAWLWDRDTEWPYSVANLCSSLDIDDEELRRRLGVWLATKKAASRG